MFGFYTLTFQNLDFTSYILEGFEFYFLKFWGVWILHPKVSEVGRCKIQIILNFRR